MTRNEVRLECLKLAVNRAREPKEVIAIAAEFEQYVQGTEDDSSETTDTAKRGRGRPRKNAENLSILD